MKNLMPALFIGHGSPMNMIQENDFTYSLTKIVEKIEYPKAILVISAHWVTKDITLVTGNEIPKQIYDFFGFPKPLYEIKYTPKGSPELAKRITELNHNIKIDHSWGLDHGTWAILNFMYPKADIPVLQLSLDLNKSLEEHFNFAKTLFELRKEGILIIGSGDIVHNLRSLGREQYETPIFNWAESFDKQVKNDFINKNFDKLIDYKYKNKNFAEMSVPTIEHYLPILYIAGLVQDEETVNFFHESIQHGSISMSSCIIS